MRRPALLGLVLLAMAGCGGPARPEAASTAPAGTAVAAKPLPRIPPEEVADALVILCDQLLSQVDRAGTELERLSPGNETRRRTLGWRIRTAGICQTARSRDNALAGLIEVWFWTVATHGHYASGHGSGLFGANQALVVERTQALANTAERMVRRAVPPERFDELAARIRAASTDGDAFLAGDPAHANPLGNLLEVTRLEGLLNLGLSPFDAFSGVKAGGDAAERMAVTADRAVALMASYPQLINWQLQSAALEFQGQDAIQALLAEVRRSNASIEAALVLVRGLPAQVRAEGVALLDESRPAQADVRETLRALDQAATALTRLTTGVDQFVGRFTAPPGAAPAAAPPAPQGPPARPFDIREYATALDAATRTAHDLRAVVAAADQLLGSPALAARLADADRTARALISTIALWAGALLIILTACVVLGVRVLRTRR